MEERESLREAENLRFRFQMNNRLRLESLAAVSKVFREFGEPISDDLLSSLVFAVPNELIASNGFGYAVGTENLQANQYGGNPSGPPQGPRPAPRPPEPQPEPKPPQPPQPGPKPPEPPQPGPRPPESPHPGPSGPPQGPMPGLEPGPGGPPQSP